MYYVTGVMVHNKCEIDDEFVKDKSKDYIFSEKHINDGIYDLGESRNSIMNHALSIIREVEAKYDLNDGPLQIRTHMNGYKVEIRIYITKGKLIKMDIFKGWSNEIKKHSIEW